MSMNDLLAQAYGTREKIAAAQAQTVVADPTDAALLDELEKTAAANGVDLSQLSDDDIAEILVSAKAQGAGSATAEVDSKLSEDMQTKLAEADLVGRAMAHAFISEKAEIEAEMNGGLDKQASAEDLEVFEALAEQRAMAILAGLSGDGDTFVKEASMNIGDQELDDLISERAAEMLEAANYDTDAIAAALEAAL